MIEKVATEVPPAAARRDRTAQLLSFPNPVSEVSARLVAGGVVLMSIAAIVTGQSWIVAVIAYGFVARVLTGPTLSPLGQLVTRVITPRLPVAPRLVAGPPKRFAQGIGAIVSVTTAILALGFDQEGVTKVLLGLLIVAATLESVFALCVGCRIFAMLMRLGVIPAAVCERCNDIWKPVVKANEVVPARSRARWAIVALAALGVGLIAMPAIFQMFDRAPKGATMISAFSPYMTNARLDGYQRALQEIDAGVRESDTRVAAYLTGPAGRPRFERNYPAFVAFQAQWGGIYADMTGMLRTIRGNVGNYEAVAALPTFTLFPWFFVAPGLLIVALLAALRLRPPWWRAIRWSLVALGIGLVAAPAAFRMFDRAPKGEHMVSAFETIETQQRVQTMQGHFGDMAVGQGAVRLELTPALERTGLSRDEISSRFPAVDALDRRWVHILNDMTPMIGAMSDNVGNYDAVASLPPFGLFPWFFVVPGLLIAGIAVAAGPRVSGQGDSAPRPPTTDDDSLQEGER